MLTVSLTGILCALFPHLTVSEPRGTDKTPPAEKVPKLVDGIPWMDARKAIRSLCVCARAEGGRGCSHCCVFNERGRVHFHVFAFQMCCDRVIKLLYGVSHLCLAVALRCSLALVVKEVGIVLCGCS